MLATLALRGLHDRHGLGLQQLWYASCTARCRQPCSLVSVAVLLLIPTGPGHHRAIQEAATGSAAAAGRPGSE